MILASPLLVSIITVNLNNASGVSKTARSLKHMSSEKFDIEWVFVDGNSRDESVSVAREFVASGLRGRINSEADDGIYSAMNRGLRLAKGSYICFMNSGDSFLPSAASIVERHLVEADRPPDVLVAKVQAQVDDLSVFARESKALSELVNRPSLPHQGALFRRDLVISIGGFDERYRLLADYDLFCRTYVAESQFCLDANTIAAFDMGGSSSQMCNLRTMIAEAADIQTRHFGRVHRAYSLALWIKYLLGSIPFGRRIEILARYLSFKLKNRVGGRLERQRAGPHL